MIISASIVSKLPRRFSDRASPLSLDRSLAHKTPLVIEQPFLAPQPAAVTAQRTVGANDAMTRNNDADHVLAIGPAHRATHLDITEFFRHPRIRARFAGWN